MSDNESCCSSETDICEFLSGFPPEELTDELLAYAAKKYCKPDDKPRKAVTTMYDDPARRLELERRLRSLKMKEGEAFDHFYHEKFENLRDELTDTGRELDDESLVYSILNALPPSWSTFVDRVVAKGLDVIPYGNLLLDIESEEENRERLRVQRILEKLQVVQGGDRIEPNQKSQPQAEQCGMMGARIELIQKPQPQVVQCGMMGARIVPIEQMKGKGVESSRSQQQRQKKLAQQQLQQLREKQWHQQQLQQQRQKKLHQQRQRQQRQLQLQRQRQQQQQRQNLEAILGRATRILKNSGSP